MIKHCEKQMERKQKISERLNQFSVHNLLISYFLIKTYHFEFLSYCLATITVIKKMEWNPIL